MSARRQRPVRPLLGLVVLAVAWVAIGGAAGCGEDVNVGRLEADGSDAGPGPALGPFDGGSAVPREASGGDDAGGAQDGGAPAPCLGKRCGDACTTCIGTSCPPVVEACDAQLRCTLAIPMCSPPDAGYVPCAGKRCGDACTQCPPGELGCIETAVLKACTAAGACSSSPVTCDGGGGI